MGASCETPVRLKWFCPVRPEKARVEDHSIDFQSAAPVAQGRRAQRTNRLFQRAAPVAQGRRAQRTNRLFQRAAPVAQGIEQDGPNVKVGGSIPSGGTTPLEASSIQNAHQELEQRRPFGLGKAGE